MEYPKNKLFEQLADIEHQRWSSWQKYMHSLMKNIGFNEKNESHIFEIPARNFNGWHRQIKTDYKDLSEREKNSDRDEVLKYWNLIKNLK